MMMMMILQGINIGTQNVKNASRVQHTPLTHYLRGANPVQNAGSTGNHAVPQVMQYVKSPGVEGQTVVRIFYL